jgi:hypothetical protein
LLAPVRDADGETEEAHPVVVPLRHANATAPTTKETMRRLTAIKFPLNSRTVQIILDTARMWMQVERLRRVEMLRSDIEFPLDGVGGGSADGVGQQFGHDERTRDRPGGELAAGLEAEQGDQSNESRRPVDGQSRRSAPTSRCRGASGRHGRLGTRAVSTSRGQTGSMKHLRLAVIAAALTVSIVSCGNDRRDPAEVRAHLGLGDGDGR